MKRLTLILTFTALTLFASSQEKETSDKKEIKQVLTTFMDCIIKKDSARFYSLFHTDPIAWVGAYKEKTRQDRITKDSTKKDNFKSTYQNFFRSISDKAAYEEKFYNISIVNDESIASVNFNYSFWENKRKTNWGRESWGLVKTNGKWKITSVIFSLELEEIAPEPNRENSK